MKKIVFAVIFLLCLTACAKTKFSIFEFNYNSSSTDRSIAFDALDFDLDIDNDECNDVHNE